MKYNESLEKLTEESIPNAWVNVLKAEKSAELLVYSIFNKCMETFTDVSVVISVDDPINGVLRSWVRDEATNFGSNAIFVNSQEDGSLVLGCQYDRYKLGEDLELFATDLFGTIDQTVYSDQVEEMVGSEDLNIPNEFKRKRIPLNKNVKK